MSVKEDRTYRLMTGTILTATPATAAISPMTLIAETLRVRNV